MSTTRYHFTFRIDTWTPDGESIVEHIAGRDGELGLKLGINRLVAEDRLQRRLCPASPD